MRGVLEAIAMAMCRPSCGCRSSSELVLAIVSWAGYLGEGMSDPACQGNPPRRGVVSMRARATCGSVAHVCKFIVVVVVVVVVVGVVVVVAVVVVVDEYAFLDHDYR
eukprot:9488268-Pyramimonas_sp.AAC.1